MRVFTDGSFSRNPNMGGFGVIIVKNDGTIIQTGNFCEKCDDNNTAELIAIAMALKYIKDSGLMKSIPSDETVHIFTDSHNALMKIYNQTTPRNNFEKEFIKYIQEFRNHSHRCIRFHQIKGHCKDGTEIGLYNNQADLVAGTYRFRGVKALKDKKCRKQKNRWFQDIFKGRDRD